MAETHSPTLAVEAVRTRYRAFRESRPKSDPLVIRLHRALSWLTRAGECPMPHDADLVLILRWMAFNSLDGQWDSQNREPKPDLAGWQQFTTEVLKVDVDGLLAGVLVHYQKGVYELFENPFVTQYFWIDPDAPDAEKQTQDRFYARTLYTERKWGMLLDKVLRRVYLVRCQLVHGAATCRSSMNREAVGGCAALMSPIILAIVEILMAHGKDRDWGKMCYEPLFESGNHA